MRGARTKVRTVTSPLGAITVTVPRASLQTPTAGRAEWDSPGFPDYARRMRHYPLTPSLMRVSHHAPILERTFHNNRNAANQVP